MACWEYATIKEERLGESGSEQQEFIWSHEWPEDSRLLTNDEEGVLIFDLLTVV